MTVLTAAEVIEDPALDKTRSLPGWVEEKSDEWGEKLVIPEWEDSNRYRAKNGWQASRFEALINALASMLILIHCSLLNRGEIIFMIAALLSTLRITLSGTEKASRLKDFRSAVWALH